MFYGICEYDTLTNYMQFKYFKFNAVIFFSVCVYTCVCVCVCVCVCTAFDKMIMYRTQCKLIFVYFILMC